MAGTYLEFCAQAITKLLRFTGSTVGSPLDLQPVFVCSCDELNWPTRVRQTVIPRKDVRNYEGIEVSNMWLCNGRGLLVQDERDVVKRRRTCVRIENRSCDIVRLSASRKGG